MNMPVLADRQKTEAVGGSQIPVFVRWSSAEQLCLIRTTSFDLLREILGPW